MSCAVGSKGDGHPQWASAIRFSAAPKRPAGTDMAARTQRVDAFLGVCLARTRDIIDRGGGVQESGGGGETLYAIHGPIRRPCADADGLGLIPMQTARGVAFSGSEPPTARARRRFQGPARRHKWKKPGQLPPPRLFTSGCSFRPSPSGGKLLQDPALGFDGEGPRKGAGHQDERREDGEHPLDTAEIREHGADDQRPGRGAET